MKAFILILSLFMMTDLAQATGVAERIPFTQAVAEIYQRVGQGFSNPNSVYPCTIKLTAMNGYLRFDLSQKTPAEYRYQASLLPNHDIVNRMSYTQSTCYESIGSNDRPIIGSGICFSKLGTGVWQITIPRKGQSNAGCSQPE